jgi:hypothetical protein
MTADTTLQIIAVALQDGEGHEDITHLQWQAASSSGITSSGGLIAWLRADPAHEAWIAAGNQRIGVEVVAPIGAPAHLRSVADGRWGEHLLALPRF